MKFCLDAENDVPKRYKTEKPSARRWERIEQGIERERKKMEFLKRSNIYH